MSKKKKGKKPSKRSSKGRQILDDSLSYGLEYGLEDGLEAAINEGVKEGFRGGFKSFAENAVEEGIGDVLGDEFEPTSDDAVSNRSNGDDLPSDEKPLKKKGWKRFVWGVKLVVVALVLAWIAERLRQDSREILKYDWTIRYGWIFVASVVYLVAFFPAAIFWFLSLRWTGQQTTFFQAVQAFYVSQLGKYLPGKAMVVVIRSAMIASEKVRPAVAAVCVFYETLTMMATGAFLSSLIVLIWFREHWYFSAIALIVMLASGVPIYPAVFVRIVRLLRLERKDERLKEALGRLTWRAFLIGVGLTTVLWILFGVALWAAIQGLGITPGNFLENMPRYISATALAIVLGFAVPIAPGGIGIREAVLSLLLIPYFEEVLAIPSNGAFHVRAETLAVIVSLEQRIISILAELSLVALFFLVPGIRWLKKKLGGEPDGSESS